MDRRRTAVALLWTIALGALTGCLLLTNHSGPWPCATNDDCLNGDTCAYHAPMGMVCEPPGWCSSALDCANMIDNLGFDCVNAQCVPPACSADSECVAFRCIDSKCAAPCKGDDQCQAHHACSDGSCLSFVMKPCGSDADCEGYRCTGSLCQFSCSLDSDCAVGSLCTNGACGGRPCTVGQTGQCDGFVCDNGLCGTSCDAQSGCESGWTCGTNPMYPACQQNCVGTPAPCASQQDCDTSGCGAMTDCSSGSFCGDYLDEQSCDADLNCMYDNLSLSCVASGTCTTCVGTPVPCAQVSAVNCPSVVGCSLQ